MNVDTEVQCDDDPVAEAVAEYLAAAERGTPIPETEWFARYPDLRTELAGFLDDSGGIAAGLRAFRGFAREPNLNTKERFIGDYELLERVAGNMGIVYRARQQSLPRDVALKLLIRTGMTERIRFRSEAEAMARLHHPHIVPIIEVSCGDVLFFSMEWCPGGTLRDRLLEYRRDPARVGELCEQISEAVHHAHQRGLLHRDLKPANVLLDAFGQPKVADFGLVIPLSEEDSSSRQPAGTFSYLAPEQLTGEVTIATDVYGIGAIMYELLTGQPPSKAQTLLEVWECIRGADPEPPIRSNPRVCPDLDAICRKCLAKDPSRRYATAGDVAADLKRYRRGQPTVARPLGPLGRVTHLVRQAREATEFRMLAPGLFAMTLVVLVSNWMAFALLQGGSNEVWVWLAIFASYLPLFGLLARERWLTRHRHNPARFHLWSIWIGHAGACAAIFIAMRVLIGRDLTRGIEAGYIGCAGVNTLAFTVLGGLFAGRQYPIGLAWGVVTVVMSAIPQYAPLLYGGLMAASSLTSGFHLQGLNTSRYQSSEVEPQSSNHSPE